MRRRRSTEWKVEWKVVRGILSSKDQITLQLDESTDVASIRHLICYVRFTDGEDIQEQLLFCEPLDNGGTAEEIMRILNKFLEEDKIPWSRVSSLCCDGANEMSGKDYGLFGLVKRKNPAITFTHCVLHRHALAMKTLPEKLKDILETVVKSVNFARRSANRAMLFRKFCQAMRARYEYILYHSDSRWLSSGYVVDRVLMCSDEVRDFLRENGAPELPAEFDEPYFIVRLGYLCAIFKALNQFAYQSIWGDGNLPSRRACDLAMRLQYFETTIASGRYKRPVDE